MAGVITTGNHPKALWPGMRAFWGRQYSEHPVEWKKIFEEKGSEKNYEEDTEVTGFGLATVKDQAASVSYDSESQGPTKRYTHVTYGLGYIVTREELEDNLYEVVSKRRIQALAFSVRQTEEIVAANIFNRAFNTSYTGADAKNMVAVDHPTVSGTQSNRLGGSTAADADLSEAAIEDLCIQIMQAQNSRGHRIQLMPRLLLVSPSEAFNAERILKSSLQSGTGNNDINAIKSMGLFPEGAAVNHYLSDPDAWFIKTNAPNGTMRFNRRSTEFKQDNDFDTENAKAKSTLRFSVGWTDWRGWYGSQGA
jgi:hypothetical protein